MNIKSNILGCLSYIGIAIEFLLIIQTYIFLDMGKYGYMLVTGSLCGDSVCHYVLEYAEKPKAGRRQQNETQGMAPFQRRCVGSGFEQLQNFRKQTNRPLYPDGHSCLFVKNTFTCACFTG